MMKLYLDDVRDLPDESFDLARSYDEAVNYVKQHGIPPFISFDHDLGVDENENLDNLQEFKENFKSFKLFETKEELELYKNNINSFLNTKI